MTAFAHGREPFRASPNKKRAHDADTSGRTADKESPLPAEPNIPDRADALEAADNGHLQELAMWNEIVGFASIPALKPLDPELARLVGSDLSKAREHLIEAMKLLDANRDQAGVSEMYLRTGTAVNEVDVIADLLRSGVPS
jgi:hypothetical protein